MCGRIREQERGIETGGRDRQGVGEKVCERDREESTGGGKRKTREREPERERDTGGVRVGE